MSALTDFPEETVELADVSTKLQVITEKFKLTSLDRCDKCSAQAYYELKLNAGELLFCVHHFNEKKVALAPFVVSGRDESAQLLPKPEIEED